MTVLVLLCESRRRESLVIAALQYVEDLADGSYFATYEVVKRYLSGNPTVDPATGEEVAAPLSLPAIVFAGGMAGVAMWSVAIPPDTIKSRLQSAPTGTYSGFLDCARQLIAKDGVKALWKGFGPAMGRAFPANAATFVGVEMSLKLMNMMF